MFEKLKKIALDYSLVVVSMILIFMLLRSMEYFYVILEKQQDVSLSLFFSRSVNFDSLFLLLFYSVIFLPFVIISLLQKTVGKILIRFISILLVFINIAFTQYFIINDSLLSSVVFDFSFDEVTTIITSEFSGNRLDLWIGNIFIMLVAIFVLFFVVKRVRKSKKKYIPIILIGTYIILTSVAVLSRKNTFKSLKYFKTNYQFLLGNSKSVFFIKSLLNREKDKKEFSPIELKLKAIKYQNANKGFNYSNMNYPFMHNEKNKNVLGKYFKKRDKKPNVVFILVESLAASFSGRQNTIGGSLTPFIDSLSQHSLYWTNFLSNAERTYGVLPNVLASLPAGTIERGFINMKNKYLKGQKYPSHNSIIQMLKKNNYHTNYYYGGWGYFDNIGYFLKQNDIDNLVFQANFDTLKYTKYKGKKGEFVWGYNDKTLVKQSFDYIDKYEKDKPHLDIFQTLAIHSPFNLVEKKYKNKEYLDQRIKALNLNRKKIKNKICDKILSTILFTDDAVKLCFEKFKKRPDFENTIFIITGDHGIWPHFDKGVLGNYHIPLIIYSPLLKKPEEFKGVCSQIDILPSLTALLEDNYSLKFPKEKHWIGQGLDTSKTFNADRVIPLNIKIMDMPNFIYKNHIIHSDRVMKLDSSFKTSEEKDPQIVKEVREVFESYKYINNYTCLKDKIWKVK